MRLLLDTNILIDFYTQREPFGRDARKLAIMSTFGDADLWVSAKSFTDIFYVLSKDNATDDIYRAFAESYRYFQFCSVEGADVHMATDRAWPDFEDCLIAICAEKIKADYLLTRDKTGFTASTIPVASPAEFFQMIERDYNLIYDEVLI